MTKAKMVGVILDRRNDNKKQFEAAAERFGTTSHAAQVLQERYAEDCRILNLLGVEIVD